MVAQWPGASGRPGVVGSPAQAAHTGGSVREANAKHESLTSPQQQCSCQTRASGGTKRQTQRRSAGQGTLRILGRFYLLATALKLSYPNTTAAVQAALMMGEIHLLQQTVKADLEEEVDLITARPYDV